MDSSDAEAEVIPAVDEIEHHGNTVYWNNFDAVIRDHNRRISGDDTKYWHAHVLDTYGFQQSAFILSCGNGWVERDLFGKGFIGRATGIDAEAGQIEEARRGATAARMPSEYICADPNTFDPEAFRADVVINVGGMHNLTFVNRVTAMLATVAQQGLYIGYDYTGPHRNQYSWPVWSRVLELNQTLPARFRVKLRYPHLKTMLTMNPAEAVHPELQLDVLQRHFDLLELQPLGGGIAYTLLFNNHRLLAEQHEPEGRATIAGILGADDEVAKQVPEANLFTFYVARPKRALAPTYLRTAWQSEEDEREATAAANGRRYYGRTALEMIYDEVRG